MTYTTFKEILINNLKNTFPECEFEYCKENTTKESLLCKFSDSDQMLSIDATGLYQKIMEKGIASLPYAISVCIKEIKNCLNNLDLDFLIDFNKAQKQICCRLIDGKRNPEIIKKAVHFPYLDLQVIFYIPVEHGKHLTECIIQPGLLELWNISVEELFELSKKNILRLDTPAVLSSSVISACMEDILPLIPEESCSYFVYSPKLKYGSTMLLFPEFFEMISQDLSSDLYLVPISETELVIEKANKSVSFLKANRDSINVPNNERLGTQLYAYRRGSRQVSIVLDPSTYNN